MKILVIFIYQSLRYVAHTESETRKINPVSNGLNGSPPPPPKKKK